MTIPGDAADVSMPKVDHEHIRDRRHRRVGVPPHSGGRCRHVPPRGFAQRPGRCSAHFRRNLGCVTYFACSSAESNTQEEKRSIRGMPARSSCNAGCTASTLARPEEALLGLHHTLSHLHLTRGGGQRRKGVLYPMPWSSWLTTPFLGQT